jgi:predicted dehydrogenase
MDTRREAATVGVVGLGGMGRRHASTARALGADVVAGADVDATARETFADRFDAATYAEFATMYDAHPDLTAVVVATPNRFHEPAARTALAAGFSVLVEKPLAHDLASAERIAATARESPGVCMVGFQNRFAGNAELFDAYRSEGRFGDLRHVEAEYVRRRGIPTRGSWFTRRETAGGGALVDIGVHALDLSLSLLGFPEVTEVSGVVRSAFGDREDYADPDDWDEWRADTAVFDVDDSASAFVRCANGATVSLEVSWAANRPPAKELLVRGTEGGARLAIGGDDLTVYRTSTLGRDHFVDERLEPKPVGDAKRALQEAFFEAVDEGEAPERNTVEQALTVQRVVDAVYRASEAGRAVAVDDSPATPTG